MISLLIETWTKPLHKLLLKLQETDCVFSKKIHVFFHFYIISISNERDFLRSVA